MDATFACLVTWLEGHSLAQTVFTNLYLHNVHEVEDSAMKAFSVAVLKIVALIKDFVNRGGVFEEEDFQPTTYGFKLCTEVSEQRCGGMLREAEEELKDSSNSKAAKNTKSKVAAKEAEREETKAISARLRFLRLLFGGLCALYRQEIAFVDILHFYLRRSSSQVYKCPMFKFIINEWTFWLAVQTLVSQ